MDVRLFRVIKVWIVDFKSIVENIAVPVVVVDRHRVIVYLNQRAASRLGDMVVGADIDDHFQNGPRFRKLIKRVMKDDTARKTVATVNGVVQREYLMTAGKLTTKKGEILISLAFEDRTPLLAAKSMRSDFVANVSHEIRSPLTALSGFVEALQDDNEIDRETRTLFLSLMAKETERMKNLVVDLLSLSKVEAKEARTLRNSVDVAQALDQAHEAVSILADRRGKRLELAIEPNLPQVLGKLDDLIRVFINLFENAINYSHEGGVVTLSARIVGKPNPLRKRAIRIDVTDEGEGIPKDEISRLTERFYRVDKSRSRDAGGTGLGLAIVKHVLVRHKGVLEIESTPGVGSTFSVYLPVEP